MPRAVGSQVEFRADVDSRRPGFHRCDRERRLAARVPVLAGRQGFTVADARRLRRDQTAPSWMKNEAGTTYMVLGRGTRQYLFRVPLDGAGTPERVTLKASRARMSTTSHPMPGGRFTRIRRWTRRPSLNLSPNCSYWSRVLKITAKLGATLPQPFLSHPTEFLQLDIGDGVVMDALMIKPKEFDETKKYPVLVYVYGEPYAQTVLDKWGAGQTDFHRVVADLGYLVVSVDNRGTPTKKLPGDARSSEAWGHCRPRISCWKSKNWARMRLRRSAQSCHLGLGARNILNAMFRKPDVHTSSNAVVPKPQLHLQRVYSVKSTGDARSTLMAPSGQHRSIPAEGLQGNLLMITGR